MAFTTFSQRCISRAMCRVLQNQQVNHVYNGDVSSCIRCLQGCYVLRTRGLASKAIQKSKLPKVKDNQVLLNRELTVKEISKIVKSSTGSIINVLKDLGEDISGGTNTVLDFGVAEYILSEYGLNAVFPDEDELEDFSMRSQEIDAAHIVKRAPVVTVMGHVDHGKTTLLDCLRKTSVAQGEAGGITQHIGAFSVVVPSGRTITFIDTPGHAAYVTMRARGVLATDIVILVVAADDGVQNQTKECIRHAKEANVPIIVAINKVDKAPERVEYIKKDLIHYGIQVEELGGDTPCVEISALKATNLDQLEEAVLLVADMAGLKADGTGKVRGVILETQTTRQRGQVATILVQQGSLRKGKIIVAGSAVAKVRQLLDDNGKSVNEAGPSTPVQVLGWRTLPTLGDVALEIETEAKAKEVCRVRALKEHLKRSEEMNQRESGHFLYDKDERPSQRGLKKSNTPFRILRRRLAASGENVNEPKKREKLEIVIKTDVNGSLEALVNTISSFHSKDLEISILHSGVGGIGDSDVHLAKSSEALIYGFNVNPSKDIAKEAENSGLKIRTYNVIYNLLDDLKEEVEKLLPALEEETSIGEAQVLQTFHLTGSKKATVAGCRVKSGSVNNDESNIFRVFRNNHVVHQGQLQMLKHGKENIKTVAEGKECGISLVDFTDFMPGDTVRCVRVSYHKQEVKW